MSLAFSTSKVGIVGDVRWHCHLLQQVSSSFDHDHVVLGDSWSGQFELACSLRQSQQAVELATQIRDVDKKLFVF